MSVFYLKHKKHGTKVATDEAEMEADKKRGWEEYSVADPHSSESEVQPVQTAKEVQKSTLTLPKQEARA